VEQARAAGAGGADFVVFGPVFDTPSKRAFGAPVGLDALAQVTHAVTLPVVAIGGLTASRVASILQAGAHGVAVVAAILEAHDPCAAAAALGAALD
jgi:thiamine-phosphate pyrophosphorylase